MSVGPHRLDRVTAHAHDADQFKGLRTQRFFRVLVNIAQDVHLALASRARTTPPQFLERNEILAAIIPFDGQFGADGLNVHRSHVRFFSSRSKAANVSGLTWCSIPSASISATFSEMPSERRNVITVLWRRRHSSASLCPASVRKMAR